MLVELINSVPTMLKRFLLIAMDMIIVVLAYIVADVLREEAVLLLSTETIRLYGIAMLVYFLIFNASSVYKNIIRYSSVREYVIIGVASLASAAVMSILSRSFPMIEGNMRIHILACIIIAIACVSYRVAIRIFINLAVNSTKAKKQRILIIGAGEATSQVVSNIQNHLRGEYNIVGMIDDSPNKQNTRMYGIEVIGTRSDIVNVVKEHNVDIILFAIQNIKEKDKNDILNICNQTEATVKVMLPMEKIIWGQDITESFRDVQVEDLLGRDRIELDDAGIQESLQDKVVLVTGAGGSIGSELCRQIARCHPKQLVMLDIYENTLYETELEIRRKVEGVNLIALVGSVRDKKRLEKIFKDYKPQIVFHAAAHKHVPLMETSPLEAIKNNVFGTYNTATYADKYKVEKFILVSTDKAVNPTNIMGATKRICEMIIQAKAQNSQTKFAAVRFGNVLGSHGSVIPIFRKQIEEGGPITITHKDITRYFMLIPEAVGLILQAMMYADSGEIFVLDMGRPVKIYDLAQTMVKLSGKNVEIKVTGLRPGEKLYEELLVAEEGLEKTLNDKIMVSKLKEVTEIEVEKKLERLRGLITSENHTVDDIKDLMKEIVPTYINVAKEGQPGQKKKEEATQVTKKTQRKKATVDGKKITQLRSRKKQKAI